jgi:hypothetical protein
MQYLRITVFCFLGERESLKQSTNSNYHRKPDLQFPSDKITLVAINNTNRRLLPTHAFCFQPSF